MTITKLFIPCADECMYAKGDECDCECGGDNHQVGTKGLIPVEHLTVTRTRAGRLINPILPGDKDYDLAVTFLSLRDEGMTAKDIAAQFGVSGPTVRRYITRLLLADELQENAEELAEAV